MMKKLMILCLAGAGGVFLPGCTTTGDPNSGGIFWSEDKAKQRIAAREARLNGVESDTASVNRRNRRLEQQLDQ
jgi:outer membrane lipoprotein-sorting protein